MALPSLGDVLFVIVLLIPGFITLSLLRWIAVLERKISDYKMVLWSLLFSLVIYAFFSWHTGIKNIDNIRDVLLYPENLSEILGLGVLMGVALGIIGRIVRKWRAGGGRFVRGDVWETSMKVASNEGRWVIVHTKDGKEYKGVLHYSGGNGEPREMSIRKPELILRNDRLKVLSEIKMGKEILFQEKDIQRIVFFEEV